MDLHIKIINIFRGIPECYVRLTKLLKWCVVFDLCATASAQAGVCYRVETYFATCLDVKVQGVVYYLTVK